MKTKLVFWLVENAETIFFALAKKVSSVDGCLPGAGNYSLFGVTVEVGY
ncbi:MAG: hypothetical protein IE914_06085 [Thiotrichales bacterium]|nr:hypothetical protein [Thiotrichales bacterium]